MPGVRGHREGWRCLADLVDDLNPTGYAQVVEVRLATDVGPFAAVNFGSPVALR